VCKTFSPRRHMHQDCSRIWDNTDRPSREILRADRWLLKWPLLAPNGRLLHCSHSVCYRGLCRRLAHVGGRTASWSLWSSAQTPHAGAWVRPEV